MKNIFLVIFLFLAFPSTVNAYYTNMPASVVVGQNNFTDISIGTTASKFSMSIDSGAFVDPQGRLIVTEDNNSRVLIFNSIPTENGASANLVLGQSDFTSGSANRGGSAAANTLGSPATAFSDGTRLVVVDRGNNRVLIWNSFPTTNGQAADVVVGQSSMTGVNAACSATGLSGAYSAWIYQNKLLVADRTNRRVLIYDPVPTTNGASASIVLGQTGMGSCLNVAASATTLSLVRGVTTDQNGKTIVADLSNNRVLIWNSFPSVNTQAADVVVGQPDFTGTNTGIAANRLSGPRSPYTNGNRLFVPDSTNNRLLVFNSIPTSNGASADLVLGQSDFTSNSDNGGIGVSARGFNDATQVFEHNNKLVIADANEGIGNARVLIFDNVLSGPQLSMNTPEQISNSKLKVSGSVQLGERGEYSLQRMQANVNGQGFSNVSYLSGGRDLSADQTGYDFYHDFEPWAGISAKDRYDSSYGYTLQLKAISFNAEEDNIFYFQPFAIKSIIGSQINLNINKDHWDRIKNNLDSFEIQTKKNNIWTTIVENIPLNSEAIKSTKSLSGEIRLVAKDKWGHRQETNSIKLSTGISSYNPNFKFATVGFPLQINRITGVNTGIISTYMSLPRNTFFTNTTKPTFSGIAYAGSTVTFLVTDPVRGSSQSFITTTRPDSTWSIVTSINGSRIIDIWATDNYNRYTELPSFQLTPLQ